MSIFGALYASVSGLSANSNALGIISDNIANANTIGYKDTSTDFSTLVTQSGSPDLYSPGGVQSSPFYNITQQGVLQSESSPTDLAVSGNGFFVVNNNSTGESGGGTVSYTRQGDFTVDANGNLVNSSGEYLQGQPLTAAQTEAVAKGDTAQLTSSAVSELQTVNVSGTSGTANATSDVSLVANLPATDTGSNPTNESVTVPVYDSEGVEHEMTLNFTPTSVANQWQVSASFPNAGGTTATIASGDNIVQFNPDGTLNTAASTFDSTGALSVNWDPAVSGGTSPQPISFNLGNDGGSNGLSQIGSGFSVGQISQDGVQFGNFTGVTVGSDGIVTANYSNGLNQAIYIVPVATFSNPDGLNAQTGNTYTQTDQSGSVVLGQAGTGSAGEIASSSLENSTVDIATEFSSLIIAQRAYEANAKILTTADQMLQDLITAIQ